MPRCCAAWLLLLALAAVRGSSAVARSGARRGSAVVPPVLRALRGGAKPSAEDGALLWVRGPPPADDDDDGSSAPLQLVRSLSKFCEEHELDEEAMLAVSRGERDEYDGWTCGAAVEYDAPKPKPKPKPAAAAKQTTKAASASDDADEAVEVETAVAEEMDDDGDAEGDEAAKPPTPQVSAFQRNKMIVGMVAPMGVVQVLKMFDQTKPEFLTYLRGVFFGLIALNTLVQMLLDWRIASTNDETPVKAPMDPLAMLMGGLGGGGAKPKQTAAEYDQKQLNSLRTSYRIGCLFTCFLHFKLKMTQPLIYSCTSSVVDLFFNPLVNIHLLGKEADGPFKRPFGAADGPPPNPLAAMMGSPPGGGAAPAKAT